MNPTSGLRDRAVRFLYGERPRGTAPFGGLRVATIVDDFTRACLEPEVTLLAVDARAWRAQLPVFRPQLLFVESTWRGVHDSWKKRIATYPRHTDDTLAEVVRYCRRRSIPTVFWNKEDPVHFDRFLPAAKRFDHVFTTEVACVERYRSAGVARVAPLLFAAQPALHFPGTAPRENIVCFAGSYGEAELGARRTDLEVLLDGASEFPLRILDRQARAGSANKFPERYRRFVHPGVDYRALAELQRRYKVFLNVNAIRASRTMFSR
nr:glycosyltransferase [Deltaproteobacteria bacterium]